MRLMLIIGIVALFTLAGAAASAEDRFEGQVTRYDMDKEDVHGQVLGPDGTEVRGDQPRKQHSLIKVRRNFIPQMLKSVEDI